MVPDTCAPTWTVTMGLTVPVAVTFARIGPRSAVVVSNRNEGALFAAERSRARKPIAASPTTPMTAATIFQDLLLEGCEPPRAELTVTVAVVMLAGVYADAVPR